MNTIYQSPAHDVSDGLFNAIVSILSAAVAFFGSLKAAATAAHEFERLSARSDAQLAAQGLTRQDVPDYIINTYLS